MTESDFPNDSIGKYLYADWLDEAGATLESKCMRAKGDLLKVAENILAGYHDQQMKVGAFLRPLYKARDKRVELLDTAKQIADTQSIRDRLKVGDWCHLDWGIITRRLHGVAYRNYEHCEVESIDGDMVSVSIKFTARNRRCSTSAQVNISQIASIIKEA